MVSIVVPLLAMTTVLQSVASNPIYNQHEQQVQAQFQAQKESLQDVWGQAWPFQGIESFAHLPHSQCLLNRSLDFDIGVIGVPFDTATTYRPGARFGPSGIRRSSQRQSSMRGFNFRAGINPYENWAKVVDCGDIPVTPMDNGLALKQMTAAYENLIINRPSTNSTNHTLTDEQPLAKPPRFVSLGGDHSILLPILRTLHKVYGEIQVIHFDSHLDTWSPSKFPSFWSSNTSDFNHGSMIWLAKQEGLIAPSGNLHVGLRTRIAGTDWDDYDEDDEVGFERIHADDILTRGGVQGIANHILEIVDAEKPVYISVDIDVLDPSSAPGTGTMECGGFLSRELIYLLRKLEDLNIVGADVVEVSPPYDPLEITQLAGAQVAYELITNMVKKGPINDKLFNEERLASIETMNVKDIAELKHPNKGNVFKKYQRQYGRGGL